MSVGAAANVCSSLKKDSDTAGNNDSDVDLAKDDDDDVLLDDHDDDLDVEENVTFADDDDEEEDVAGNTANGANGKDGDVVTEDESPSVKTEDAPAKVTTTGRKVAVKKEGAESVEGAAAVKVESTNKDGAAVTSAAEDDGDKVDTVDVVKEPVTKKAIVPLEPSSSSSERRRGAAPAKTYIKLKCVHCDLPIRTFNVSPLIQ